MPRLLRPRTRTWAVAAAAAGAALLAWAGLALAGSFRNGAHGNESMLPRGCGACHAGHGIPRSPMLPATRNETCLACHSTAAARTEARTKHLLVGGDDLKDVSAEFAKASHHTLSTDGQAASSGFRRVNAAAEAGGTVTCSNCHDGHYLVKGNAQEDITRVKEIGNARNQAEPEYRLCYRCHGTTTGVGSLNIEQYTRQSNPSFHPVEATGRNTSVPSLINPWTVQSYTACTSCHGSDQAAGPRGPHGSAFTPILKANYNRDDDQAESAAQYALCYRCHNRNIVLSEEQGSFRYHKKHMEKRASCRACHNSHGSKTYTHLIDFDTSIVFANSNGVRNFVDSGANTGACNLRCHDKNHVNLGY
ncbi:MAG TPA: cytochrome c3 family protein [Planctomycetota bacterium]|nr:cytochrome c3 family protein [Planctomycetota bacterium]